MCVHRTEMARHEYGGFVHVYDNCH